MNAKGALFALATLILSTATHAAENRGDTANNGVEYLSETWIAVASATREGTSKETCHIVIIPKVLIRGDQAFGTKEAMRLAKEVYSPKKGWRDHKASIHHAETPGNEIHKGSCLVEGRSIPAGG